jgi:hypothetical protein
VCQESCKTGSPNLVSIDITCIYVSLLTKRELALNM